jgi:hypothetical protein
LIQSLGAVKADAADLNAISAKRARASEIMDKVRFDDGPAR